MLPHRAISKTLESCFLGQRIRLVDHPDVNLAYIRVDCDDVVRQVAVWVTAETSVDFGLLAQPAADRPHKATVNLATRRALTSPMRTHEAVQAARELIVNPTPTTKTKSNTSASSPLT